MMTPGFATTRLAASRLAAGAALMSLLATTTLAQSQAPAPPAAQAQVQPAQATATPARVASSPRPAAPGPKANGKGGPVWRELNAGQHQSLAPLASSWDSLSEAQKRKWLVLSANYPKMSAEEQSKLHSRMAEWVALSPQQRTEARLNFGETQKMAPDAKKAKWEAYQALSAEEKSKLAAGAAKPPTTAAAVRPVSPEKLAAVPKAKASADRRPDSKPPRIAAAPHQVDHNTLLPQQPSVVGGPN